MSRSTVGSIPSIEASAVGLSAGLVSSNVVRGVITIAPGGAPRWMSWVRREVPSWQRGEDEGTGTRLSVKMDAVAVWGRRRTVAVETKGGRSVCELHGLGM